MLNKPSSILSGNDVIVTGASGFVGRHVVRHLLKKGVKVLPLTRSTGNNECVKITSYFDAPEGEVLIHLAQDNNQARVNQLKNTVKESEELINHLLRKKYNRVVYGSSAAVYGDAIQSLRKPSQEALVTDNYTEIKSRTENAVLDSRKGVAVRLSNLYGRGMSSETLLRTILRQIPGKGELRVRDVGPVRDYLWIEDVAEAIYCLAMGSMNGVYNVGSGVGTSVGQLADLCLKLAGEEDRLIVSEDPGRGVSYLVLDIEDTTRDFNWRPRMKLAAGVKRLLTERNKEAL